MICVKGKRFYMIFVSKNIAAEKVPRLQLRKGDNKKQSDGEDIGKLWKLLDNSNVQLPSIVASDLRRIPQIDPSTVDLCFLVESIEELRKQVARLLDIKEEMVTLREAANREK